MEGKPLHFFVCFSRLALRLKRQHARCLRIILIIEQKIGLIADRLNLPTH